MISAYLQTGTTLLVGLVAIIVYYLGKRGNKTDSAKVVEIEINSAQKTLSEIKKKLVESKGNDIGTKLTMPTKSWEKYKHMFVSNFSEDEWNRISEFYENCNTLDEAITLNKSFFDHNSQAIRNERYKAVSRFIDEEIQKVAEGKFSEVQPDGSYKVIPDAAEQVQKAVLDKMSAFNGIVSYSIQNGDVVYNPDKPLIDSGQLMNYMELKILDGELGSKLRKIANRKL